MAANDVYTALSAAITADRTINLWTAANGSPALADLVPVLRLFGITSSYELTQANLAGDDSSVTLTASGTFGQPGAESNGIYRITATLTYTDGAGFTLTLRVVDDRPWTFAAFFRTLPDSMRVTTVDGQATGVRWTISFLIGSQPGYEVVVIAPSFTGRDGADELQLDGFLPEFEDPDIDGRLGDLLSPWPLRLSGSIEMPADPLHFPILHLTAQGSSTNMLSGSTEPGVQGPPQFQVNALTLLIDVDVLDAEDWGHDGISGLRLSGSFELGGGLSGTIFTNILQMGSTWAFTALFDPATSSFTQGLASLAAMFGVPLPIPMDFPLLSEFHFAEVDVDLWNDADDGELPDFSLRTFAITIKSKRPWVPPVPFVSFKDVGIRWVWGSTVIRNDEGQMENIYLLTGSVFGSIEFGGSNSPPTLPAPSPSPPSSLLVPAAAGGSVTIDVSLSIPSFYIYGAMREGDFIAIGRAFEGYFDGKCPFVPLDMNVTALSFTADPIGQVYQGEAQIVFGAPDDPQPTGWTILEVGKVEIRLQRLEMWIQAMGGRVAGGISGVFFLQGAGAEAYTDPQLLLRAEYPQQNEADPQGWLFAGYLYPGTSIDLTAMVARFIMGNPAYTVPGYVPQLLIDRLEGTFATGTGAYTFKGTASMRWNPQIFGTEVKVNASAGADIARAGENAPVTGTLEGRFAVNKIAVVVAMDIGVDEPTYLFKVMFGEVWVQASTAWRGSKDERRQVVSVQLGGVTLGDILEYLVNLAAPTLGFHLDPPWDILGRIDLSRFVLTLDPKENVVEFTFNAAVNLGVMRVDKVGARYIRGGTGQGKVELILTGNFFGEAYSDSDPLSWDVVADNPPAVPGEGASTVDLRFLGLGQRVTFSGPTPDSVAESVALLRGAMKPPVPGEDPLAGTGLAYSKDSQWLIGLDVGLMNTVSLGFIFNDPKLYGLSVALGGERAGALGGLRFEILYKKITDDTGLYRIELRVPDAFRTFGLGPISLTLAILVVEIYTNGNFKIDMGFPWDRDYSRSFSLKMGSFIGRGGFYFGILNGDTSMNVPRITNGDFSPVIELGVGLSAGVGREANAGILAAGAYIEIQVIYEGVFAWFNPTSSGAPPATFFRAKGVMAIHGKVYGKVNFVVVSASVTIEAFAQGMAVFESYQPVLIDFSVGVRAEASAKVLFIRVKFHFQVKLDLGFTIGSASPTPWILAGGGSGVTGKRSTLWLSVPRHAHRRALMRHGHLALWRAKRLGRGLAAGEGGYLLEWQPDKLVFDTRQSVPLTMLPYITVGRVPVDWKGGVPLNPDPKYRAAFLLFADTGIAADAQTAAATAERSAALCASGVPSADLLVTALMRYALHALPDGPSSPQDRVNAGQLLLLAEQLGLPQTATAGFGMDQLNRFFHTNLKFHVSGMPAGDTPKDKSAMLFPMPPGLAWTSPQAGDRDFSSYNKIGTGYEAEVARILDPYFPVGGSAASAATDDPGRYESFATGLFRGFCQMVVKAAIEEAQKQLTDAPVEVTGNMSLADASRTFTTQEVPWVKEAGDTVQSVAARTGATAAELLFLNSPGIEEDIATKPVGDSLSVFIGVSPEMLVQDNSGVTLKPGQWPLGDVPCAVGTPDTTLADLARRFNVPDVARLFTGVPPPRWNGYTLGQDPNLLQEGRTFELLQQTFVPPADSFTRDRAAALFFVRYADPDLLRSTLPGSPDMPAWYEQAIAILNPEPLAAAMSDAADSVEIDPGTTLKVPRVYGDRNVERLDTYTTVAGDTLHRIACALVLARDHDHLAEPPPQWSEFRSRVTQSGTSFSIPPWPLTPPYDGIAIQAGGTAESLARRLVVNASFSTTAGWRYDWTAISTWLAEAKVLSPLAVVVLPGARTSDAEAFTFQTLADTYGLTLSDVATRLQNQTGLLPDPTTLTVRQLPVQTVEKIEERLFGSTSFAGVVNQASQMMMSGLRLPALKTSESGEVGADPANPLPLYDLSGQQFDLAVDTASAHAGAEALTMTVTSSVDWVTFAGSVTVEAGHDLTMLRARHPRLLVHESLATPDALQPGMVLLSSIDEDSLVFHFTNEQILEQAPATGLKINTVPASPPGPTALPLEGTVPRTYGFEQPVTLQSPEVLPIPTTGGEPLAGYASLWPFPQGLIERAAAQASTPRPDRTPYRIFAGSQPGATADNARPLPSTTYGCQLSFRVRRMDDGSRRFHLLGVDTSQRGLLLALHREILSSQQGAATRAWLAVAPAPNASNAQGVALLDPSIPCFLIKTNLSTDSQPEPAASLAAGEESPASPYYADFVSDLAGFLLLLWEGSVAGGTGYYFGFGQDLPGSAFDGQGTVTLALLAIAGSRQDPAPAAGRTLEVFDNCLLVAPGLDASIHSLYAEAGNDSDLSEVSLTPPGNAGFTLTIDKPQKQEDRQTALQDRYSTLVFWCHDAGSPYEIPPAWTPALPTPSDGKPLQPWERQRLARQEGTKTGAPADDEALPYQRYEQVIPFYRFTKAPLPAATPGLPDPAADPYRGFGGAASCPEPTLTFCMSDLLGNHSEQPREGEGAVKLTVGYTDPFIGLSQWPELAAYFEVLGTPAAARLEVQIGLKAAASVPTSSQRGDAAVSAAQQQSDKYALIDYQLTQNGVGASLSTSLRSKPGDQEQAIAVGPLWRFAAGAYAYAMTAAQLRAVTSPGKSLDELLATYPVRYAEMAVANEDVLLEDLFEAGPVDVPVFMPFIAQRSLQDLYEKRPAGWPAPTSAAGLFSLEGNADLPLVVGVPMNLPDPVNISTGSLAPTPSLAQLAEKNHIDAGLLAEQNAGAAILAASNELTATITTADGATLTVQVPVEAGTDSFSGAQKKFADNFGVNLTVAQIAIENAGIVGLLKANQTLRNVYYITKSGDTPGKNLSGVSTPALGAANAATPGIFDGGALVQFGSVPVPLSSDTLNMVAQRYSCPPDLLLSSQGALRSGGRLAVPGCFAWPQDEKTRNGLRVPYTVRANDRLSDLCPRFARYSGTAGGATVNDCVAANANVPGTLAQGVTIHLQVSGGNVTITTLAGASFASTLAQAQAINPQTAMDALAVSIASLPGALQPGALLLFPLVRLPRACAPKDITSLYGVDSQSFALANTATLGLIAPGVSLRLPNTPAPESFVEVSTQANDTFNTLIVRFSLEGVATDAGAIVLANPEAKLFAAEALALLPPAPVRAQVPLGSGGPYPRTVFALNASLMLTRPPALIHPEFSSTGPVGRASSPLPPRAQGDALDSGSLTFGPFIKALTDAIPDLRVGTAKVAGETSDLWCVDFSSTGIAAVSLEPGVQVSQSARMPRFLALPPLYDHLVTRSQLDIWPLNDEGTLGDTAVPTNFQAIDTEPWAQRFLSDLDRFLGGPMATGIYQQPELPDAQQVELREALTKAIESKQTIAGGIAGNLQGVFDESSYDDPHYERGVEAAREALRQQLYVSLLEAYDTSVVVQYDVKSTTPWTDTGVAPPVSLYGQAHLADTAAAVNFAAAKTGFDPDHSFVTFFATVADPARHRSVEGTLEYAYSYAEFDISDICEEGVPPGYQSSNWLSFIPLQDAADKPTALEKTNPGSLRAPVPLRVFPSLPIIREQTASVTHAKPDSLAELPLWTYKLTCTHEFAAQDNVHITADFNISTLPRLAAPAATDLFGALAQYVDVADRLWTLLNPLSDPAGDVTTFSVNAATTFATLAASVAGHWQVPQIVAAREAADTVKSFGFRASVTYSDSDVGPIIVSFSLTSEQDDPGPGGTWPEVEAIRPDGVSVPLQPRNSTGSTKVYLAPAATPDTPPIPAQDQQTFRIAWSGINVSAYQNARARMLAVRNETLLDDLLTSTRFRLATGEVTAISVVTPLIERSVPQGITGEDLGEALAAALQDLFPSEVKGTTASWCAFYAHELVRDSQSQANSLLSKLPVAFYPNQNLNGTAAALAAAAQNWTVNYRPAEAGGGWLFGLVLYSGLEESAKPLFSAELSYRLEDAQ